MSEYALYKGRPVKILWDCRVVIRDKDGKDTGQRGEYLGTEVQLPFGHKLFATKPLEPLEKDTYERLVKEEKAEKERLSKKDGLGSCEFLALKRHGTNAAQDRGR